MRQEACKGPEGFTRRKKARGGRAGAVPMEAAGNGGQEGVGAAAIPSCATSATAPTSSMRSLCTRGKVGVAEAIFSTNFASTPTLARKMAAAKEPMRVVEVGAPELTLATGFA